MEQLAVHEDLGCDGFVGEGIASGWEEGAEVSEGLHGGFGDLGEVLGCVFGGGGCLLKD